MVRKHFYSIAHRSYINTTQVWHYDRYELQAMDVYARIFYRNVTLI